MRNNISDLIKSTRKNRGIPAEAVYSGICSRSVYYRIEDGSYEPDSMLLFSIADKISIPHDYYKIINNAESASFDKEKQDFFLILKNGDYKALKARLTDVDIDSVSLPLHKRFYMKLRLALMVSENVANSEILKYAVDTLRTTCPDFDYSIQENKRYDFSELALIGLYAYKTPNALMAETLLKQIAEYCHNHIFDNEERSLVLPGVAILLNRLHIDKEYSYNLAIESIGILRDSKHLHCIDKLLQITEPSSSLTTHVKKLVENVPNPGMLSLFPEFFVETQYAIGDYIRSHRIVRGYTRSVVADQVCDESTLFRIEKNLQNPQDYVWQKVMRKLDIPIENNIYYYLSARKFEILEIGKSIQNDVAAGKYGSALAKIKWLETKLDMNIPVNEQFVSLYNAIVLYEQDRVGINIALCLFGKVLKKTVPEKIDVSTWTFSDYEIIATCYICELYYKLGKKKEAFSLAEKMYLRKDLSIHNKKVVIMSLVKLYDLSQRYNEAVDLCKEGVVCSITSNDAIFLCRFDYMRQMLLQKMGLDNEVDVALDMLSFWNIENCLR